MMDVAVPAPGSQPAAARAGQEKILVIGLGTLKNIGL
jgi:hypothetical protein